MPVLTHPMTRAQSFLEQLAAHIGTEHCPDSILPQNRLQALTLRNALGMAELIDDLDREALLVAGQLETDLVAVHHLLAAHRSCPTCIALGRRAAQVHLDLGRQI